MRPPQSPGVSSFCGRSPASSWSRFRCLLTPFGSQFITGPCQLLVHRAIQEELQ
ncbi:hypothetical protein MtrunA17_Chr7g0235971 [Medicago truncatula]|uniref:Uncharacterized protein n=1 Tax=Medicago truncatula TaxID=3880 RepID=A0A396GZG4_MEDTR|nr:hypothetical protein MtrunA17_Chr7g0235971 [Medicago truncatula]